MGNLGPTVSISKKDQTELLALLKEAQDKDRQISRDFLAGVAQSLNISSSDAFGVASFYSFLSVRPLGRYVIRICKSLPCYLQQAPLIIDVVKQELGIHPGQTTADSKFTLELANCIGACDQAPAMLVNHILYGNLTPEKIIRILRSCA